MSFAISGCSGSGKTTLAVRVADRLGVPYFDASFGKMARLLGYDSVAPMTFGERLAMQERVLDLYRRQVALLPRPFVTDRCPLDMIGYCLGELTMHDGQAEHGERVDRYVDACASATAECFDSILFCRPLSTPYEASPHRPPASRGYQLATQAIIEGSFHRVADVVADAYLTTSELGLRTYHAERYFGERMERLRRTARRPGLH